MKFSGFQGWNVGRIFKRMRNESFVCSSFTIMAFQNQPAFARFLRPLFDLLQKGNRKLHAFIWSTANCIAAASFQTAWWHLSLAVKSGERSCIFLVKAVTLYRATSSDEVYIFNCEYAKQVLLLHFVSKKKNLKQQQQL